MKKISPSSSLSISLSYLSLSLICILQKIDNFCSVDETMAYYSIGMCLTDTKYDSMIHVNTYLLSEARKRCFDVYIDCTVIVVVIKRSRTDGIFV